MSLLWVGAGHIRKTTQVVGGDGETLAHGLRVDLGTEINIWTTNQSPTPTGPVNDVHVRKPSGNSKRWSWGVLPWPAALRAHCRSLTLAQPLAAWLLGEGAGSTLLGGCQPAALPCHSQQPGMGQRLVSSRSPFESWLRKPEGALGKLLNLPVVWRWRRAVCGDQALNVHWWRLGEPGQRARYGHSHHPGWGAAPCRVELFRPLDRVKSPLGRRTRRRENYPDRVWHSESSKAGCINTCRISKWKCTRGLFNAKSEEMLEDMKNFSGILSVRKSGYWNDVSQYAYIHVYIQYTPLSRYLYLYRYINTHTCWDILKR